MRRITPLLLAALVGLNACSDQSPTSESSKTSGTPSFSQLASESEFVPGQLIVRFTPGAARSEIAQAHRAQKKADMLLSRTEILEVPVGEELAIAEQLSKNPNVEFAEPDYIMKVGPCEISVTCTLPDGSFFHYKWDLHNTGSINDQALGYGVVTSGNVDADIDWAEAYDYLTPTFSGSAVIGILDTGIRTTHQAFTGKILGGRRFVCVTGVAPACAPAASGTVTNFTDDHGHGSHVAGIAAARGTTPVPGVGYGPNIKLLILKVCDNTGSCPNSATANAIIYAADNGANILNLSLGAFGSNPDGTGSAAQQAAFQYAATKNVLAFCSTGNDDGKPNYTGGVGYPARFPECVAVASTNWTDTKANYSNYGPQTALSAPGGAGNPTGNPFSLILAPSHTSNTGYNWRAGTSMAAPQVAGLAALLYATGLTNRDAIRERLQNTVDDLGAPGRDPQFGFGRINAYRALTGLDPSAPPVPVIGGPYAGSEGSPVAFDGSASFDPNGKPITVSWNFGDGNTSSALKPNHTFRDNGAFNVLLTAFDAANNQHRVHTVVAINNVSPTVSASLNTTSIMSGQSVALTGGFSDPGLDDSPWGWSINWGNGITTGQSTDQASAITGSRQFCAVGGYNVTLTVTDKDGGPGTAAAGLLQVLANGISIAMPAAVNNNNLSEGTLPVTVFGSASFNVTSINASSVRLGTNTAVQTRPNGSSMLALEDVNGDGYLDLVMHFSKASLVASGDLAEGTVQLGLRAVLGDACTVVAGAASIKVVP